jgi:hypothetical protein
VTRTRPRAQLLPNRAFASGTPGTEVRTGNSCGTRAGQTFVGTAGTACTAGTAYAAGAAGTAGTAWRAA